MQLVCRPATASISAGPATGTRLLPSPNRRAGIGSVAQLIGFARCSAEQYACVLADDARDAVDVHDLDAQPLVRLFRGSVQK